MESMGIGFPLASSHHCGPGAWQAQGWDLRNPHLVILNIQGNSPFLHANR